MQVNVNDAVRKWMLARTPANKKQFNTKCTQVQQHNDLSTWRNVGGSGSIYDYNVSGDYRAVAQKNVHTFLVAAIYQHAPHKGKVKVVGANVPGY